MFTKDATTFVFLLIMVPNIIYDQALGYKKKPTESPECTDQPTTPPQICVEPTTQPPTTPQPCIQPTTAPPTEPPTTPPITTTTPPITTTTTQPITTTTPPITTTTTPPITTTTPPITTTTPPITTTPPPPTTPPITITTEDYHIGHGGKPCEDCLDIEYSWEEEDDGPAWRSAKGRLRNFKTASETSGFECAALEGKYPNELSCSMYYECSSGVAKLMACAAGTFFSASTGTCTSDSSECAYVAAAEFDCSVVGTFAVPKSCREYYVCVTAFDGSFRLINRSCLTGHHYDPILQECVVGDCTNVS